MAGRQRNFLAHLHVPMVSRRALHPLTTLGLGIAAMTCLGVLLTTGITLFLYYVPEPGEAYERILHISTSLRFGGLIRNLHYLAANALVIVAVLHLARVFLTGSYRHRLLNWGCGLLLLLLVLLANFTGYLLPWDQISYWAAKVGANLLDAYPVIGPLIRSLLLGGDEIGSDTLPRAFALHAGAIPAAMLCLVSLHLWRIRKDGGLAASRDDAGERLAADPWLYRAEGGAALATLAVLLFLALVIAAPIHERADPLHPPNPAKAPWYFVGVQEMVSHSVFIGGVAVPTLITLLLLLAPLVDRGPETSGRWFPRERLLQNVVFLAVLASQIVFIVIGVWLRIDNWQFFNPF